MLCYISLWVLRKKFFSSQDNLVWCYLVMLIATFGSPEIVVTNMELVLSFSMICSILRLSMLTVLGFLWRNDRKHHWKNFNIEGMKKKKKVDFNLCCLIHSWTENKLKWEQNSSRAPQRWWVRDALQSSVISMHKQVCRNSTVSSFIMFLGT